MTTTPEFFDFQLAGAAWLTDPKLKRKLLADQMGLGKSAQTIKAMDDLNLRDVVIVCPSIARYTWAREIRKFSRRPDLKIRIMEKRKDAPHPDDEIILCTFDYATHNFSALTRKRRSLLIVDEAHFLKEPTSKRTQAILGRDGLIHSTERAWHLTGTPVPNMKPNEAWPMLFTFGATTLNYKAFVNQYCDWYDYNGRQVITGADKKNFEEFKKMLQSVMLRRLKKDVLKDLPPVLTSMMPVEAALDELTPQLKEEFRILQETLRGVEKFSPIQQLSILEGVAGSVGTLRRYCAMMKVKPIVETVKDELERGEYQKIIIFGIHREALIGIERGLSGYGCVRIGGDTSPSLRQQYVDRFQTDPTCCVLAGNIQAAGTNITLTEATEEIFLEQSFVPGENHQARDRASRIGSRYSLNVRIAALNHTVDVTVQSILANKIVDLERLYGI